MKKLLVLALVAFVLVVSGHFYTGTIGAVPQAHAMGGGEGCD